MLYSRTLLIIFLIYSSCYLLIPNSYFAAAAAAAKSLQSCATLCDPIDGSPPGSPVPGILQERTLEWVAISFSSAWKWKVKVKPLSRVWFPATPWIAVYQAPPSMGFSRQEYWSGVLLPSLNSCFIPPQIHFPFGHHKLFYAWEPVSVCVSFFFLFYIGV